MEDFLDIKQGLQNIRFPSLILRIHFIHSISLSSVLINYDAVVKDH